MGSIPFIPRRHRIGGMLSKFINNTTFCSPLCTIFCEISLRFQQDISLPTQSASSFICMLFFLSSCCVKDFTCREAWNTCVQCRPHGFREREEGIGVVWGGGGGGLHLVISQCSHFKNRFGEKKMWCWNEHEK